MWASWRWFSSRIAFQSSGSVWEMPWLRSNIWVTWWRRCHAAPVILKDRAVGLFTLGARLDVVQRRPGFGLEVRHVGPGDEAEFAPVPSDAVQAGVEQ